MKYVCNTCESPGLFRIAAPHGPFLTISPGPLPSDQRSGNRCHTGKCAIGFKNPKRSCRSLGSLKKAVVLWYVLAHNLMRTHNLRPLHRKGTKKSAKETKTQANATAPERVLRHSSPMPRKEPFA